MDPKEGNSAPRMGRETTRASANACPAAFPHPARERREHPLPNIDLSVRYLKAISTRTSPGLVECLSPVGGPVGEGSPAHDGQAELGQVQPAIANVGGSKSACG